MNSNKIHLVTQDDQPYGSERRCCEICGTMVWPAHQGENTPKFTEDRSTYHVHPDRCCEE